MPEVVYEHDGSKCCMEKVIVLEDTKRKRREKLQQRPKPTLQKRTLLKPLLTFVVIHRPVALQIILTRETLASAAMRQLKITLWNLSN